MKQLHKNIKIFYLATTLTTLAASLPHAVLTVLLFAVKACHLTQIMLVQATYSLVILVSEYPSGLLADLYSKSPLLWAKVFLSGMFLLVWLGESFRTILLAWACYGLAMALESGTLDAQLINELNTKLKIA